MLFLKTLLRCLILPPANLLLLAAGGLLLQRYRPVAGRLIVAASVAALWVLSLPAVSEVLTSLTEHYGAFSGAQSPGAQAIVILGGGGQIEYAPEYGGAVAKSILLERVTYGAYLARSTRLPVLVTGNGIEAVAMRETLARSFDVPVRWDEERARDTFENAANSAALLLPDGVRKIILVTSSTHMYRSVREFEAVGFEVSPAPVSARSTRGRGTVLQYVPAASALQESSLAFYELIGEPVRRLLAAVHVRRHPAPAAL